MSFKSSPRDGARSPSILPSVKESFSTNPVNIGCIILAKLPTNISNFVKLKNVDPQCSLSTLRSLVAKRTQLNPSNQIWILVQGKTTSFCDLKPDIIVASLKLRESVTDALILGEDYFVVVDRSFISPTKCHESNPDTEALESIFSLTSVLKDFKITLVPDNVVPSSQAPRNLSELKITANQTITTATLLRQILNQCYQMLWRLSDSILPLSSRFQEISNLITDVEGTTKILQEIPKVLPKAVEVCKNITISYRIIGPSPDLTHSSITPEDTSIEWHGGPGSIDMTKVGASSSHLTMSDDRMSEWTREQPPITPYSSTNKSHVLVQSCERKSHWFNLITNDTQDPLADPNTLSNEIKLIQKRLLDPYKNIFFGYIHAVDEVCDGAPDLLVEQSRIRLLLDQISDKVKHQMATIHEQEQTAPYSTNLGPSQRHLANIIIDDTVEPLRSIIENFSQSFTTFCLRCLGRLANTYQVNAARERYLLPFQSAYYNIRYETRRLCMVLKAPSLSDKFTKEINRRRTFRKTIESWCSLLEEERLARQSFDRSSVVLLPFALGAALVRTTAATSYLSSAIQICLRAIHMDHIYLAAMDDDFSKPTIKDDASNRKNLSEHGNPVSDFSFLTLSPHDIDCSSGIQNKYQDATPISTPISCDLSELSGIEPKQYLEVISKRHSPLDFEEAWKHLVDVSPTDKEQKYSQILGNDSREAIEGISMDFKAPEEDTSNQKGNKESQEANETSTTGAQQALADKLKEAIKKQRRLSDRLQSVLRENKASRQEIKALQKMIKLIKIKTYQYPELVSEQRSAVFDTKESNENGAVNDASHIGQSCTSASESNRAEDARQLLDGMSLSLAQSDRTQEESDKNTEKDALKQTFESLRAEKDAEIERLQNIIGSSDVKHTEMIAMYEAKLACQEVEKEKAIANLKREAELARDEVAQMKLALEKKDAVAQEKAKRDEGIELKTPETTYQLTSTDPYELQIKNITQSLQSGLSAAAQVHAEISSILYHFKDIIGTDSGPACGERSTERYVQSKTITEVPFSEHLSVEPTSDLGTISDVCIRSRSLLQELSARLSSWKTANSAKTAWLELQLFKGSNQNLPAWPDETSNEAWKSIASLRSSLETAITDPSISCRVLYMEVLSARNVVRKAIEKLTQRLYTESSEVSLLNTSIQTLESEQVDMASALLAQIEAVRTEKSELVAQLTLSREKSEAKISELQGVLASAMAEKDQVAQKLESQSLSYAKSIEDLSERIISLDEKVGIKHVPTLSPEAKKIMACLSLQVCWLERELDEQRAKESTDENLIDALWSVLSEVSGGFVRDLDRAAPDLSNLSLATIPVDEDQRNHLFQLRQSYREFKMQFIKLCIQSNTGTDIVHVDGPKDRILIEETLKDRQSLVKFGANLLGRMTTWLARMNETILNSMQMMANSDVQDKWFGVATSIYAALRIAEPSLTEMIRLDNFWRHVRPQEDEGWWFANPGDDVPPITENPSSTGFSLWDTSVEDFLPKSYLQLSAKLSIMNMLNRGFMQYVSSNDWSRDVLRLEQQLKYEATKRNALLERIGALRRYYTNIAPQESESIDNLIELIRHAYESNIAGINDLQPEQNSIVIWNTQAERYEALVADREEPLIVDTSEEHVGSEAKAILSECTILMCKIIHIEENRAYVTNMVPFPKRFQKMIKIWKD